MKKSIKHPFIGAFLIGVGGYFVAIGLEFVEATGVHVPYWVMSVIGLLCILCGCVLVRGRVLAQESFVASLILLCFSMIGYGIGFFHETTLVEKWVFGMNSTICLLLSLVAMVGKKRK